MVYQDFPAIYQIPFSTIKSSYKVVLAERIFLVLNLSKHKNKERLENGAMKLATINKLFLVC